MNQLHYQLARARRDDFLREAANHRLVKRGVTSARFRHLLVGGRRVAQTSRFNRHRAAAQTEA
jgi:hypothetical protein